MVALAFVWLIIGAIFGGMTADPEPKMYYDTEKLPGGGKKTYWDNRMGDRGVIVEDAQGNVIYSEDF